jgi:predicted amidohydrolase YtcJ
MKNLWLFGLLLIVSCQTRNMPADLIIKGGKIYTVNEKQPEGATFAVRGDTIVFAGTVADVAAWQGEKTEVIDLQGSTMTPGFIESHGHIMGLGYFELNLDLSTVKSFDELVEKVRVAAAQAPPGQWILGNGWHQDKWEVKPEKMVKGFQTHEMLSAVSPNNPVWLRHASGHAGFANAKAMELAGVNPLSKEGLNIAVEGGEIIKDKMGNPTGIFNERAMALITKHIPENTPERDAQALELAMETCARNGITSFHDAGASRSDIELFNQFNKEQKLKSRLYVMLTGR